MSQILKDIRDKIKSSYCYPITTYDCMKSRLYEEPESRERGDGVYQRDYTRIMYSSSFRRLQGKMQLLGIKSDQFFRNRLTHSLEVAQIARSIATELDYQYYDIYVVEAAALAHDLGNPPFGHYGEQVLNKLCVNIGGFEGNAQTLRILTNVERKRPLFQGLNLTYRTLLSVIKYFKKFDRDNVYKNGKNANNATIEDIFTQKFIYDDDYAFIKKFIEENETIKLRTIDTQILDIADEIAYAAHDLEDGLRQKIFTIDEITHDFISKYGKDNVSSKKLQSIVTECQKICNYGENSLNSSEYAKLIRKELASSIINTLIQDIDLVDVNPESKKKTGTLWEKELGFKQFGDLSSGLKKIIFECIYRNDEIFLYEQKGSKIIEGLFGLYSDKNKYLPPEYRANDLIKRFNLNEVTNEKDFQQRLIADYISGMMDSFAITTFKKFYGEDSLTRLH